MHRNADVPTINQRLSTITPSSDRCKTGFADRSAHNRALDDHAIERQVQRALRDQALAEAPVDLTGRGRDDILELLAAERKSPGSTVLTELRRRGVTPHVFSDALEHV